MQNSFRSKSGFWVAIVCLVIAATAVAADSNGNTAADPTTAAAAAAAAPATAGPGSAVSPTLVDLLVKKGILTSAEANSLRNVSGSAAMQQLLLLLKAKGVVTDTEAAELGSASADAVTMHSLVDTESDGTASANLTIGQAKQTKPPEPTGPTVVPAITPIRVLPVTPPTKDGLAAAFKMGPVKMTPYGFIKATAAYDTSSPNGDDFPFVGLFLSSTSTLNTGPNQDPEFHLKARSTRIGANFEWPDISPKIVLTGRVEGDFEGNFSEVDNRDVSSIRSNAYQLRLAWARLDYQASDKTDIYFEGGQDWTLFGSTTLPSILETTFLGAYYGVAYERSPQFQFGLVQKLSSWRNLTLSPTFALMMPSSSQIEKLGSLGLAGQIGQAEREGADSAEPELEARVVLQFQLDKAKGVAPAQVIWSGFLGHRESIVTSSNYAAATASCLANPTVCAAYQAAYPNGFTTSSDMYGNQISVQLPTRWVTIIASGYKGGDMRFFFAGQVNSYFTDTGGLTNPIEFATVDGGPLAAAGAATLGTNAAGQIVIAPQRPIRGFGGFISAGLPLSRWFNADPKGHNAGWQVFFTVGKDQVVHSDLINPAAGVPGNTLSPLPLLMGKFFAGTLYYKLNNWCQFGYEESVYGTRLEPGVDYTIAGHPENLWQDHRFEFGPIFTF